MSESVTLRPLKLSDAPDLARLANNRKVWDNLRDYIPFPYQESDAELFINLTLSENPKQNLGIVYQGELCGVVGCIVQQDVYQGTAEIGYWLGEPYWAKGIATQAVKLMTEYGFDVLGLTRIYAGIFEFNTASMRVLEKNGFEREGILKSAITKNGKECDEHRFYKLRGQ